MKAWRFARVAFVVCTTAGASVFRGERSAYAAVPTVSQKANWRLIADARFGCGDAAAELGNIEAFAVSPDGAPYVYDASLMQIIRFDAKGRVLGKFGRKGSGPGEFRAVIGMEFDAAGHLWVVDGGTQRYSVFGTDGKLIKDYRRPVLTFDASWTGGFANDGLFYDQFFLPLPRTEGMPQSFLRLNSSGVVKDSVALPPKLVLAIGRGAVRFPIPYGHELLMALDHDGSTVYGVSDGNVIFRRVPGSTERELMRLNVPRISLTAVERDSVKRYLTQLQRELGVPSSDNDIPPQRSWLRRIVVGNDSRIWLLRGDVAGGTVFDVYDRNGQALARATAPREQILRSPLRVLNGDNVWGLVKDENDLTCLVRFRTER